MSSASSVVWASSPFRCFPGLPARLPSPTAPMLCSTPSLWRRHVFGGGMLASVCKHVLRSRKLPCSTPSLRGRHVVDHAAAPVPSRPQGLHVFGKQSGLGFQPVLMSPRASSPAAIADGPDAMLDRPMSVLVHSSPPGRTKVARRFNAWTPAPPIRSARRAHDPCHKHQPLRPTPARGDRRVRQYATCGSSAVVRQFESSNLAAIGGFWRDRESEFACRRKGASGKDGSG